MPLLRDFFCHFIEVPDLDEMVSMAVFEVVKFASVMKTDLVSFLDDLGIILAQRLGLCWECFAVRARWLRHHVSRQISLRDRGTFAKILYLSKIGEITLTISKGGFFN